MIAYLKSLAYNAAWPLVAVALTACTYTLADHERDGYIRSFAEERNVPPIQFVWEFEGDGNSYARRLAPGQWLIHQPARCREDIADVACQRSAVAHTEAAYHREAGMPRCVVELRKHQGLGKVPNLDALGCDHTGAPL